MSPDWQCCHNREAFHFSQRCHHGGCCVLMMAASSRCREAWGQRCHMEPASACASRGTALPLRGSHPTRLPSLSRFKFLSSSHSSTLCGRSVTQVVLISHPPPPKITQVEHQIAPEEESTERFHGESLSCGGRTCSRSRGNP